MRIHVYYVYILTNTYHNVLYTGVTNDLERRCYEHKQKKIKGFTQKYNVDKLIYFERFDSIDSAIDREKQIKGFSRGKKLALINKFNKDWKELSHTGLFKTFSKFINVSNEKFIVCLSILILGVFRTKQEKSVIDKWFNQHIDQKFSEYLEK